LTRALQLCAFMVCAALFTYGQASRPVISGGAGFIATSDGGNSSYQPVIAPVAAIPLGDKFLIEARGDVREFIFETLSGHDHQFFGSLEYLQLDYIANRKMTITVGRFLTPFGIYNERITPIWIRNFQDAPIIFPIGTRTTGSSDGAMVRGVIAGNDAAQWNYAAYFSASSNVEQFVSGRAAGFRTGLFFPHHGFEAGVSYQRFLQDQHVNATGLYAVWQPPTVPIEVRSEFAHSSSGQGYWIEGASRVPDSQASLIKRLQPIARFQQFFRDQFIPEDSLPGRDTSRFDAGFNYYLPSNVRVNASYGRVFSGPDDRNVWNVAVTYRILFPISGRSQ